ncbi:hypothetical protein ACM66B_004404 [Microbotryomycetes sp. NB124-2]
MSNTTAGATNLARAVLRSAKNTIKGNSPAAIAARDASSNDPYGPAHFQLCQVAELTFNETDCADIIAVLDKRLSDSGKLWRHVFKALAVIEHCLLFGSRLFVRYFLENKHLVKSLKEFRHVDESNVDQGANIRERAREVYSLLDNEERLYYERKNGRGSWRDRPRDYKSAIPYKSRTDESSKPKESTSTKPGKSQTQLDEERAERELQEALRISREEEEERQRLMKAQQADVDLFDVNEPVAQNTAGQMSEQEYWAQQQQAQQMAWLQQQQAQYAYQQAIEQQAAYAQQQQQMMAMQQAAYLQQQQQAQMNQYYLLQQQQQAAYLQQQQAMTMQQQQQPTGQPLPQTNPFSAFAQAPSPSPAPAPPPVASPPPPTPSNQLRVAATGDARHSELARMLANGPGEDTFGNRAELRFPT